MLAGCFVNAFVDIEDGKLSSNIGDKLGNLVGTSKARNSQNLLDPEYYTDLIEGKMNGVKVTVNKDGSITLDGEVTAETQLELYSVSGDVIDTAYTFTSVDLGDGANNSVFYWSGVSAANSCDLSISSEFDRTFVISSADCSMCSSHTFGLKLSEGDSFDNVTIYPVLSYGYVPQPFYVKSEVIKNAFGKKRNSDNLLDSEFYEDIDGKHNGVEITVNDDGSITLDGEASGAFALDLFKVLDSNVAGSIFIVSGFDLGDEAPGASLRVDHDARGMNVSMMDFLYCPIGYNYVFRFPVIQSSSESFFTLQLTVAEGDSFDNVTIYPVLNTGITAVSYFE